MKAQSMPTITSIATCIAIAASHYGVSPSRIDATIRAAESTQVSGRIGPMGIPTAWMPYLKSYGFNVAKVQTDACQNVIAGAWILATTDRISKSEQRWAGDVANLPARAQPWQFTIRWIADKAGISAALLNSVIEQESRFNPDAIGPKTKSGERAIGLMQILPSTAKELGINPKDPVQNIWGGAWYLANLARSYGGNIPIALAAYNAGPGAVAKYGGIPPYKETQAYVPSIMQRAQYYADASN